MSQALQQQVDLSAYNSFAVPATAAWFLSVTGEEDVRMGLQHAARLKLPILVLGEGSNILFVNDFPGLVLRIANRGIEQAGDGATVTVAGGENWHDFVSYCLQQGLHGLENLALIPGTVGAAPVQNIGAYGVELASFVERVEAINLRTGKLESLDRQACDFGYRDSVFKRPLEAPRVILRVTFGLSRQWQPDVSYRGLKEALPSSAPTAQELFDTVCRIRRSKLPDPEQLGNAGSFFKNPVISAPKFVTLQATYPDIPGFPDQEGLVKVPAAWLLEEAGWKGRRRGAAGVHADHALVLVNHGGASGEDIYLLAQEMSSSVLGKFGIALQPEVRII